MDSDQVDMVESRKISRVRFHEDVPLTPVGNGTTSRQKKLGPLARRRRSGGTDGFVKTSFIFHFPILVQISYVDNFIDHNWVFFSHRPCTHYRGGGVGGCDTLPFISFVGKICRCRQIQGKGENEKGEERKEGKEKEKRKGKERKENEKKKKGKREKGKEKREERKRKRKKGKRKERKGKEKTWEEGKEKERKNERR